MLCSTSTSKPEWLKRNELNSKDPCQRSCLSFWTTYLYYCMLWQHCIHLVKEYTRSSIPLDTLSRELKSNLTRQQVCLKKHINISKDPCQGSCKTLKTDLVHCAIWKPGTHTRLANVICKLTYGIKPSVTEQITTSKEISRRTSHLKDCFQGPCYSTSLI